MNGETGAHDERKHADARSYDAKAPEFDDLTEQYSASLASRMINFARLDVHDTVLDLGTGTGLLALRAAARTTSGRVVGIDHSEGMLDRARAKADAQGLTGRTNFQAMDAEALDFPDGHFNVILSLFVLLHLPNPHAAIREMYRVLKPGGRIIVSIGARPPLMSRAGATAVSRTISDHVLTRAGMRALSPTHLRAFLASRGVPAIVNHAVHARLGDVASALRQAGFNTVTQDWYGEQFALDAEAFWDVQAIFDSQARTMLGQLDAGQVVAIKNDYLRNVEQIAARGGNLIYRTGALVLSAER